MTREEIQGLCALHTTLAKAVGFDLDKKAARYSAMADYVEHVFACGPLKRSRATVMPVIWEAVSMGLVGEPENIPCKKFDRQAWEWMEITHA